jgi:hypothetical protein
MTALAATASSMGSAASSAVLGPATFMCTVTSIIARNPQRRLLLELYWFLERRGIVVSTVMIALYVGR